MAGQQFSRASLLLLLGVLVTVHSVTVTLHLEERDGNTLRFRCSVSVQLTGEERIDFKLNSRLVGDIPELMTSRHRVPNTIDITVNSMTEGFFTCSLVDRDNPIATSASIGPFAADPGHSENQTVPLFYVGVVGSSVTLQPRVPLGSRPDLYTYTWTNGTSHNLSTVEGFFIKNDGSLSITSLKPSHNGGYSLVVQVTAYPATEPPLTYTNNNYRLQVQEMPHFNDVRTSPAEVFVEGAPQLPQFRCSVQGYPDVSIKWYHNDLHIRGSDSKYQILDINDNVPGPPYTTANSTLMIRNLVAADNGVVSCVAQTNGCNATLSRALGSCHPMIFEEQLNTTLSVLTREFQYNVTVRSDRNMELRIKVNGKPIPTAVCVHIKYITDESEEGTPFKPDGSYTNARYIYVFIPNSETPATQFKIKVALGTDAHTGPFVLPIRDVVYDINIPNDTNDNRNTFLVLAIAVPCGVVGVIVLAITVVIIAAVIYWKNLVRKEKLALKLETPENAIKYKLTRQVLDGSESEAGDDEGDFGGLCDGNVHQNSAEETTDGQPQASRVVTDDEEPSPRQPSALLEEKSVSLKWIEKSDAVFSSIIRDVNKRQTVKTSDLHDLWTIVEDQMPLSRETTV